MLESGPQTHSDAEGYKPQACDTCGSLFTPKRSWGRFCDSRCRNAFHQAEARIEAIEAKAPELYAALAQLGKVEGPAGDMARRAIAGLKPPATPKQLLEDKAKP